MNGDKLHQPCPCGRSSDAYAYYANGNEKCYSCGKWTPADGMSMEPDTKKSVAEYREIRGLSLKTVQFYGIKTRVNEHGVPLGYIFPYTTDGTTYKYRDANDKQRQYVKHGDTPFQRAGLFGQGLFQAGGSDSITITEGEFDAPAVFQMVGQPAVSVGSGASGAKRDCQNSFEYLNSFNKIVLCFDSDEEGKKAVEAVAPLFDHNKLYVVKLSKYKDANDFLRAGDVQEFRNAWYNARHHSPDGVISSYRDVESILLEGPTQAAGTFPFDELNAVTHGLRTSEVVLVTAQEGVGKTEFFKATEHHLLKTTNANIGAIHLEDKSKDVIHGVIKYELGLPVHLDTTHVSHGEKMEAFSKVTRREDRFYVYSHYGADSPDELINIVRFLAGVCECKFILLDSITVAVDGMLEADERKVLDYLATRLSRLSRELDICIICINHLTDDGKTRGSRLIQKLANVHIRLERDPLVSDPIARNKADVVVIKNREIGTTGKAGTLIFDETSHTLRPYIQEQTA